MAERRGGLVAGSPTAHSSVGITSGAVAKLTVEANGSVLAESPWLQTDRNQRYDP